MLERLKELYIKNKEVILYLIFGGGTTIVDWVISFLLYRIGTEVHTADVIAWIAAVAFAYITNRIFVFRSKAKGTPRIIREIIGFASSRMLTFVIQEVIIEVLYGQLEWNKYAVKIAASVIVVILNYVFSKLIIFRKGNKHE
ncbi:MAG: GtrA family protein [Clostridia bacterium]|nr:GtrA family protein [Clostridia bacterium]